MSSRPEQSLEIIVPRYHYILEHRDLIGLWKIEIPRYRDLEFNALSMVCQATTLQELTHVNETTSTHMAMS